MSVYTFTSGVYTICTPAAVNQPSERHVSVLLWPPAGALCGEGSVGTAGYSGLIAQPGWEAWKRAAKRCWERHSVSPALSIAAYISDCLSLTHTHTKNDKMAADFLYSSGGGRGIERIEVESERSGTEVICGVEGHPVFLCAEDPARDCESCCPWSWTDKTSLGKITSKCWSCIRDQQVWSYPLSWRSRGLWLSSPLHCQWGGHGTYSGWWWAYCQI